METNTELKEVVEQEINKFKSNEHSIYDYMKKTPSIFIASISALVAIITFFAKLMTNISAKQELAFWEIKPEHFNTGTESIVFIATIAIVYALINILLTMWFSATCDAYWPYKKRDLTMKYLQKALKKSYKKVEKASKKRTLTEEEKSQLDTYSSFCKSRKEVKKDGKKKLFSNLLPIFFIMGVVTFFFAVTTTSYYENVWLVLVVCVLVQSGSLWIITKINSKYAVNKKELKEKCMDPDFIKEQKIGYDNDKYPVEKIFSKGLRSVAKNSTIIAIVVTLLLNCFVLCITYSFTDKNPIKRDKYFQTTELKGKQYAIVYQVGNQYFLEEAEIMIKNNEDTEDEITLTVYTNKQRIIFCDDIIIETKEYHDIIKEHKIDELEENSQNQ